jgi:hypothetical protein
MSAWSALLWKIGFTVFLVASMDLWTDIVLLQLFFFWRLRAGKAIDDNLIDAVDRKPSV